MPLDSGDFLASDDPAIDEILAQSRKELDAAGPSTSALSRNNFIRRERHRIEEEISQIDAELKKYDDDIKTLQILRETRRQDQLKFVAELNALIGVGNQKGKGKAKGGIDYGSEAFEWSNSLKSTMRDVFKIKNFRLCQLGVCNANMDGRDIVCVMPTGGGKSLTYQLPALLHRGCTLVISPLISLISDQIMHLQEAGINAVKLTGSTSKEEQKAITRNLYDLAAGKLKPEQEIRLVYVTPEKIARSNPFKSLMTKLADNKKLSRIVIDEAHCVSQLGHDFRPDYKQLRILRELFPRVPILALSATCPPRVLQDLRSILQLPEICDGNSADLRGTTYFSAPLYRKNLHYKAFPKDSNMKNMIKIMTDYILEYHPHDSGIVYCLTRNDAEIVAQRLYEQSEGKILTGVYHAEKKDGEKEDLHVKWRKGNIKVVCATIAFGLGIDKGDVRFVLHHSKSLDGFYQESGRAGRDGKDADCVLYYRPQDAWDIAAMTMGDKDGSEKLMPMILFCQNTSECRKLQFAKYFSHSSDLSISDWATEETGALDRCGHCDNCLREGDSLIRDVTYEAWQLTKLVAAICDTKNKHTARSIATIAKSKTWDPSKPKMKQPEYQLETICDGPVDLHKDDIELLLIHLWSERYLKPRFVSNAHKTTAYVEKGVMAGRLTSLSSERAKNNSSGLTIRCAFPRRARQSRKRQESKAGSRKGKAKEQDDIEDAESDEDDLYVSDREDEAPKQSRKRSSNQIIEVDGIEDDDDDSNEWMASLRGDKLPRKRPRTSLKDAPNGVGRGRESGGTTVIEISDSE
ncbi:P-loop containing nucleoside triphosphate hydrolase protein [Desarmillaria tabescens]|uniref:ATP-dependent DNA helicase n=1 Tax=Armillaria tabescens TaxID=1929756 RepID=A0AA39NM78_ARMTA|nr:P-loop containing nucleoside triphosphate hydrolase protein [Desarmillaria tabescens]KAK0468201.1 P-loop containing nucleoside triphosphate hydrolase protein [Desarmillaria tabescens]